MPSSTTNRNFFATAGRYACGAAAVGMGLMQMVNADFVRLVPPLPAWWPEPRVWAVVVGLGLLVIGAAIITGYRQWAAALTLGVLLLGSFLLQRVPEILANPGTGYIWTNPAKVLAMLGGMLLLAGVSGRGAIVTATLLGIFLLICGVQHFVYAGFVDTLVPVWIPPGQRFWTNFTAVALLAGGLGVMVPATRRLAGLLAGAMIFLWVVLLHLPRSVEMKSAFELAGVFEALALAGVAWLVAGPDRTRRTA